MTTETACERCGLKVVRKELERDGIVMRFCEECYWGEAGGEAPSGKTPKPAAKEADATPSTG